ncbi:N-acetyltransferase family protein [Streptomyces sp. 796.1]|uniref:GNAT family N-acetyltransferase n=1 Tax=Streptomyces sp. 796.1 TaxID=3163029 RepID=UPI0039C8CB1F
MARLTFRQAREEDHAPIVAAIRTWWGGTRTPDEARELSLLLPRLFLQHFAATSLILEGADAPAGAGSRAAGGGPAGPGHESGGAAGAAPGGVGAVGAAVDGGATGVAAGVAGNLPPARSGGGHPGGARPAGPAADGALWVDESAAAGLHAAGGLRTADAGDRPGRPLAGFLIGFHSPDRPGTAYIHFVGVHPGLRQHGIARALYGRFFARATSARRPEVRAIVSPANKPSIAFHHAMGFVPDGGDYESDGVPVHRDYDGPGHDRISFRRLLSGAPAVAG